MPLYFRKSIGAGPFRVNLSRRGVGYSVGAKGFRVGRSATGRTYTSARVPGTGLRVSHSLGRRGCAVLIVGALLSAGLGIVATRLVVAVI